MTELAHVLRHVGTTANDPAVLVGLDAPDDAAVYRVAPDVALVQTVDFFTPVVDDPYAWGWIAAANAVSDVYAMGGTPVTALNLVSWPRDLDFELLGRVLDGGSDACARAGVAIVGGHSVDDPEPKYGLAVTGTVHPDRVVRKTGGRPGAALVLTKPLGTGILSSGIKQGATGAEAAARATDVMMQLNRGAAEAMLEVAAQACTDVTGFGLLGHLLGMLDAGVAAEVDASAVPVLPEALELARRGVVPGGTGRNRDAAGAAVDVSGVDDARATVLFDAQTSGGLLIAVARDRTQALLDALAARGVEGAVVGGLVERRDGVQVVVR